MSLETLTLMLLQTSLVMFGAYFQIHAKTKLLQVWNFCVLRVTMIWRNLHLHPRSALTLYPCLLPHRRPEGSEKRYAHTD